MRNCRSTISNRNRRHVKHARQTLQNFIRKQHTTSGEYSFRTPFKTGFKHFICMELFIIKSTTNFVLIANNKCYCRATIISFQLFLVFVTTLYYFRAVYLHYNFHYPTL
uniref:Uncharacterized protein n=1 Tax=Adoxophyes orana granulovirus TaxID=170617 RepID=A0A0A0VGC2_GVAO|nr:hypothetical protein [Adoxophyes orana granulovirus]